MLRSPASTLVALTLVLSPLAADATAAQQPEHETTRIADGVYMFRHRAHNTMFLVTGAGVVAFDPISVDAARIYRREIERVTSEPIRAIVYSHYHADHVTGAAELASGVPIIAHARAQEHLTAEPQADVPVPDVTFTDRMTIRVGAKTIRLIHLGPNHTDDMIVAHLPDDRIVFAVDFVSNDRVAYRDLPGFHLPGLWDSLERLQQLDYDTAVFGHGPPGSKGDVYEQINYWADLRSAVEAAVRAGLSEDEAVDEIELPAYSDWGGYENWFKMNARALYRHYSDRR